MIGRYVAVLLALEADLICLGAHPLEDPAASFDRLQPVQELHRLLTLDARDDGADQVGSTVHRGGETRTVRHARAHGPREPSGYGRP